MRAACSTCASALQAGQWPSPLSAASARCSSCSTCLNGQCTVGSRQTRCSVRGTRFSVDLRCTVVSGTRDPRGLSLRRSRDSGQVSLQFAVLHGGGRN